MICPGVVPWWTSSSDPKRSLPAVPLAVADAQERNTETHATGIRMNTGACPRDVAKFVNPSDWRAGFLQVHVAAIWANQSGPYTGCWNCQLRGRRALQTVSVPNWGEMDSRTTSAQGSRGWFSGRAHLGVGLDSDAKF
ncbi:hypothetical protein BJX63DRAFT_350406 [Aspergillus granulosus]|uniref:Uncharacterized protein n=1 Tax=Aspergillus granulosus TaxID=176169 RepID=A0ABR4H294_9EURO